MLLFGRLMYGVDADQCEAIDRSGRIVGKKEVKGVGAAGVTGNTSRHNLNVARTQYDSAFVLAKVVLGKNMTGSMPGTRHCSAKCEGKVLGYTVCGDEVGKDAAHSGGAGNLWQGVERNATHGGGQHYQLFVRTAIKRSAVRMTGKQVHIHVPQSLERHARHTKRPPGVAVITIGITVYEI